MLFIYLKHHQENLVSLVITIIGVGEKKVYDSLFPYKTFFFFCSRSLDTSAVVTLVSLYECRNENLGYIVE